jgi:hypothetical protein
MSFNALKREYRSVHVADIPSLPVRDPDPIRQAQLEQIEENRLTEVTIYGEMRKRQHPFEAWVHPAKRLRQPSIFPGDKVRLRQGLDKYMYEEIMVAGETRKVPRLIRVKAIMPNSHRLILDLPVSSVPI